MADILSRITAGRKNPLKLAAFSSAITAGSLRGAVAFTVLGRKNRLRLAKRITSQKEGIPRNLGQWSKLELLISTLRNSLCRFYFSVPTRDATACRVI